MVADSIIDISFYTSAFAAFADNERAVVAGCPFVSGNLSTTVLLYGVARII